MLRAPVLARLHLCKCTCVIGELRKRVVLVAVGCLTLIFIRVIAYNYGCNYVAPASVPVALNSTFLSHYLIEEPNFCHQQSNLTLVAYVHSSLSEVERRQQTRRTWASAGLYDPNVKMAVVFMVGLAKTEQEQTILREESQRYHDIVQGNYTDTYHLLSHKALASLHWVSRHCSHVPWTLHADDDVLVDVFLLKKFLSQNITNDSIFCYPWENSPVRRLGKWCVRHEEYSKDIYPTYCAGGAWVMATPLGQRLLDAAYRTSMLWVDDVYLTGLLASDAGLPVSGNLKKHIKKSGISDEDLGNIVIWFDLAHQRTFWWKRLLTYYGHYL